jgi:hypothetical protein
MRYRFSASLDLDGFTLGKPSFQFAKLVANLANRGCSPKSGARISAVLLRRFSS